MFSSDDHVLATGAAVAYCDAGTGLNWPEISSADIAHAPWRKSSWSASNGNCVEIAPLRHDLVGVRDSKDAGQGPVLVFDGAAWRSFLEGVKGGD